MELLIRGMIKLNDTKLFINVNHYNYIQIRHLRSEKLSHQSIKYLRKKYIFEKNKTNNELNCETSLSITNESSVTTHKKPTSVTVDILGRELWPQMTEWRFNQIVQRARRVLPLPISLTGLGDGQMPRYWRHVMRKAVYSLEKKREDSSFDNISPSIRLMIENFPEKVKQMYPQLYQNYMNSKESAITVKDDTEMNRPFQFPYQLMNNINEKIEELSEPKEESDSVDDSPRFSSGLIDADYDNYLKHHHLLQFFALNLKVSEEEYFSEIEGWRDQFWRRNYGSPDPNVPVSRVPCSGCGAYLHCSDSGIPGYIPSEKYKLLSESQLRKEQCQRCEFLQHFNICLDVNVLPEEYPKLISHIRQTKSLVIIMVDLLDFPCSIWPGIINIIGERKKIFIVGNKVDLLPKDDGKYLERVRESLKKTLHVAGVKNNVNITDISLISAKTGYGIEDLITKLMRFWKGKGDIYLIGCTNVGKSTLFNALLQSDLCKLRESDLINRATTSVWPGTTLRLIKFPINKPPDWELELRWKRLERHKKMEMEEIHLKNGLYRQTKNKQYATISGRIGMTYRSEVPFSFQSGHPFAKRSAELTPFNPDNRFYQNCDFFYDTPGTIYKDQILTLLTTEELLKTVPREMITPRTFTLRPLQTLFIGGLARVDLVHARSNVWFTVFASHYLPIHVVYTEEARRFYNGYVGTDMLKVPFGGSERMKRWPLLYPKEMKLHGINWNESCADIVLSSAGWTSVTFGPDSDCVVRAYTPEGRGIYLRQPPVLPFAFRLRGKRIVGTPCFENKLFSVDDVIGDDIPKHHYRDPEYVIHWPYAKINKS